MNLKEHFYNTLEIMIEHDPACDVHKVYYCSKEYDCENFNCRDCKAETKVYADIIFTSIDEEYASYYVFDKEDNRDFVKVINNEEEMYEELLHLNLTYIGKFDRRMLSIYQKIDVLQGYADKFAKELHDKYLSNFNPKILPIKFITNPKYEADEDNNCLKSTNGEYCRNNNQNIICIYDYPSRNEEELKRTIRHEIIHYALDVSGLKCGDSDAVFHALGNILDARPYKVMNEKEQQLYDDFMYIYNSIGQLDEEHVRTLLCLLGKEEFQSYLIDTARAGREGTVN